MVIDATDGHGDDDVGELAARGFYHAEGAAIVGRIVLTGCDIAHRIVLRCFACAPFGECARNGCGDAAVYSRSQSSGAVTSKRSPRGHLLCASGIYRRAAAAGGHDVAGPGRMPSRHPSPELPAGTTVRRTMSEWTIAFEARRRNGTTQLSEARDEQQQSPSRHGHGRRDEPGGRRDDDGECAVRAGAVDESRRPLGLQREVGHRPREDHLPGDARGHRRVG